MATTTRSINPQPLWRDLAPLPAAAQLVYLVSRLLLPRVGIGVLAPGQVLAHLGAPMDEPRVSQQFQLLPAGLWRYDQRTSVAWAVHALADEGSFHSSDWKHRRAVSEALMAIPPSHVTQAFRAFYPRFFVGTVAPESVVAEEWERALGQSLADKPLLRAFALEQRVVWGLWCAHVYAAKGALALTALSADLEMALAGEYGNQFACEPGQLRQALNDFVANGAEMNSRLLRAYLRDARRAGLRATGSDGVSFDSEV